MFFDRPGSEVCGDLAAHWMNHTDRRKIYEGQAKVLGLQTDSMVRFFTIEEVVLFEDSYTRERWPRSRSLSIASLSPAEVISFMSQGQHVLTFAKTQGAENIMFSSLQEIDRFGDPLRGEGHILTASSVAKIVGLTHGMRGQLTPIHFRGGRAFLLATGARELSDQELDALEKELMEDFESLRSTP